MSTLLGVSKLSALGRWCDWPLPARSGLFHGASSLLRADFGLVSLGAHCERRGARALAITSPSEHHHDGIIAPTFFSFSPR
jgi:hypothetical protein